MSMQYMRRLIPFLLLFPLGCQPSAPQSINIIDNGQVTTLQTYERVPSKLLEQAGITLDANDHILLNGLLIAPDQPITNSPITMQIRRGVTLTLVTPLGQQTIESAALTVGEALADAGVQLGPSDFLDPPANTIITSPLTINHVPPRELSIDINGRLVTIHSSAGTVGEVLAEAGIPLLGLDYSSPHENEAPPPDGKIRVVRVSEAITLALKSIPFPTETIQSPDLELGQQEILQPGLNGLGITRTRIRYEDGKEVSRETESETVARSPQTRIVHAGTKLVSHTLGELQYWYSIQMYATSYSPCRSGIDGCSYGTASGLPAQKGVVAMSRDWYNALQGMEVYVPGYGRGIIGDLGGGFPDGRPWIDLGYNDDDYQTWGEWVTVYFLGSPPATIPYILEP
jgi:uncharacterized protein YabE (DUF348 family)